jgi:hypothetical protein
LPLRDVLVEVLHKRPERRDAGAGTNEDQVGVHLLRHLEGQAVGTGHRDAIAGNAIAQIVGGDTGIFLTAVLVHVANAAHGDLDPGKPAASRLRKVGHAVETEVVGLPELSGAWGEHTDVLSQLDLEVGLLDLQGELPDLGIRRLRCDPLARNHDGPDPLLGIVVLKMGNRTTHGISSWASQAPLSGLRWQSFESLQPWHPVRPASASGSSPTSAKDLRHARCTPIHAVDTSRMAPTPMM